jgi:hypothetical protein
MLAEICKDARDVTQISLPPNARAALSLMYDLDAELHIHDHAYMPGTPAFQDAHIGEFYLKPEYVHALIHTYPSVLASSRAGGYYKLSEAGARYVKLMRPAGIEKDMFD